MSFARLEEGRHHAQPTSLFMFIYGDGPNSFFAYTNAEQEVVRTEIINGIARPVTYLPIPIERGAYSSSGTLDKSALEVRIPQDLPLAELFRVYPPSQVVNLFIREGHLNDPDHEFLVCWTGRVLSCSREDNQARFSCEPISTSLKRNGLRRPYQYGCPHVLYGPQCRANKAAATTQVVPVSAAGVTIQLAANWAGAGRASKYLGGMAEWKTAAGDTILRTILRVSGNNVFSLNGRITDLPEGAAVNMILGCNHQMDDCRFLHNNILNYGGMPWIPTKNPIGMRSQYY